MIDAVLRITVEERSLGLVFTLDGLLVRLPTTLRIAERLAGPAQPVLPLIGALFLVLGLPAGRPRTSGSCSCSS